LNAKRAIAQGASLYLIYRYLVSADISQLNASQTIGCFKRTAIAEVGGSLNV
jgi:hypothetical protein